MRWAALAEAGKQARGDGGAARAVARMTNAVLSEQHDWARAARAPPAAGPARQLPNGGAWLRWCSHLQVEAAQGILDLGDARKRVRKVSKRSREVQSVQWQV